MATRLRSYRRAQHAIGYRTAEALLTAARATAPCFAASWQGQHHSMLVPMMNVGKMGMPVLDGRMAMQVGMSRLT